jgi:hypothetical protein
MSDGFLMYERHVRNEDGRELDFAYLEPEAASETAVELQWERPESVAAHVTVPIQMRIEEQGVFPDYKAGFIPFVSARVKAAIERSGSAGVSFFPIEVTNATPETPSYFAIHCSAFVRSEVGEDGRVVIDEPPLGVSVFRSIGKSLTVTAALKAELDDVPTLRFENVKELEVTDGD